MDYCFVEDGEIRLARFYSYWSTISGIKYLVADIYYYIDFCYLLIIIGLHLQLRNTFCPYFDSIILSLSYENGRGI